MENTTAEKPTAQVVHLLIRESGEYEEAAREVIAALTCEEQASLLMQTREAIEAREDAVSYEIQTIQVHASAAAVLGLA